MAKYAVVSAALIVGFAVLAQPALAAPLDDDPQPRMESQVQPQAQPRPYNTEEPARIRQEMDRRAPDDNATAPVGERAPYADRSSGDAARDCANCPLPRNYDSTEVLKQTRDIDHTRVIETQSVVPSKRLIETNHLIIRENETRNVGVVQHNHTIIEKELVLTKRNVDTKTVNNVVNLVEHKYNTERKRVVEEREIPGENRDITCPCDRPGYGPGPGIPAYGQAKPVDAYAKAPKYVNSRY